MTDTTWQPVTVRLADLTPWERNPKRISKAHAGRLLDLWQRLGQFQTIAIGPAGEVYDGHQRLSVLKAAHGGKYEVQALQSSRALTEKEREELTIAAHVGTTGQFDWDALSGWDVGDLNQWGFDAETLTNWQTDIGALGAMLASEEEPPPDDPGAQIDRAEELRELWGVQPGQLWQLGEHRLICGDCTDAAVVARVMDGERAGMVFTDPPYATFGSSTGKMELGDYNMLRPFWQRLVETIHENTQDGRGAFICCDWRSYPSLFEVVGRRMKPANLIVWNHKAIKLGAQFRPAYELLLYAINHSFKRGWKDQEGNWKIKDRSISDVWEIGQGEASPGSGREHSSQKPVALVEFAVTHCSEPGDIVTDYFSGSGTTLIACERLGRRCRAVEIEPGYVAVAIQRWVDMTGGTPRLVEDAPATA